MLHEEPMHAYRMQQLIQARGKDLIVNIKARASLYQTINRLERLGLVTVSATITGERHPDRIVYAITAQGRATSRDWLRDMLAQRGAEFPGFPAALSVLTMLTPAEAADHLQSRLTAVQGELDAIRARTRKAQGVPAIFLIEDDYRQAALRAERRWLGETVRKLRDGSLNWSAEWLREIAAHYQPDDTEEK
jgi:DNA-binding PadR family transcriptional regulator